MRKKINLISFNLENIKKNVFGNLKKNQKITLIGNWCQDNKKNEKIESLNFYKWNLKEKKTKDEKKINKIYEDLLNQFSRNLNKIHKKNYPKKYWESLINRWLMAFIVDIYSKWQISEKIISRYKIKKFFYIKLNEKKFIPENTFHHNNIHKNQNGHWSHFIFRKIMNYKLRKLNELELSTKKKIKYFSEMNSDRFNVLDKNIINFSLFKKIVLYNLSFDKKIIFHLKIKNFFLNIFFKNFASKLYFKSKNLRYKFCSLFSTQKNNFENFLIKNIHLTFPKIFLENYEYLEQSYLNLKWPKNPDFILTTYGHYYNELFKIYCAKNMMNNSKLFIFQHGDGGIFADNDSYNIGWDKRICDKYFVWGKNTKNGYKSFFYTKKCLEKNSRFLSSKRGKILLIMYGFNEQPFRPINGFNDNYETNKGLILNNKNFLSTLSSKIKRNINVKLLDNSKDKNVKKDLKKNLGRSAIIEANQEYLKILDNYNLIVHFYLGTPFFESMLFNKPSIIILNKHFQLHFDKKFEIFVNKFMKNKIIFKSADEAGLFVNKNYYSIEKWWNSKKVQDTRREFCNMYCRNFKPNKDLINLFKI